MPRRMRLVLVTSMVVMLAGAGCARHEWMDRSASLRDHMRVILSVPDEGFDLDARVHRTVSGEGYVIHAVTYASEPGSRVTASLYLPNEKRRVPAVVVACGHGGSKSSLYAQYAGQLYAKMGFACLIPDTIGEEERHFEGRMGTRAHDLYHLGEDNPRFVREELKRLVLGKIVLDLIRGIDYLERHPAIDAERIGIVGTSLGGASAGCVAILDDRVKAAVISGWVFSTRFATWSKYCTRMPWAEFNRIMSMGEMTALVAPHCATLFMLGSKDDIIDHQENGSANVRDVNDNIAMAHRILRAARMPHPIEVEIESGAGHRPYLLAAGAVQWVQAHLVDEGARRPIPDRRIAFGAWVDGQGQRIEKLYNTDAHKRGLLVVDVDAVWREPRELACFPDRDISLDDYTMRGWVERTIHRNAGR